MNSNLNQMYRQLGIGEDVLDFGEQVLSELRARFDEIDANAEYNQLKVVHAMQKNRVDATCFAASQIFSRKAVISV